MKVINAHGWTALVLRSVMNGNEIIFIEILGNKVHVDAIVAALLNKNQRTYGTTVTMIDGSNVMLEKTEHYKVLTESVKQGHSVFVRAAVVHLAATTLVDKPEHLYLIGPDDETLKRDFVVRLVRKTGLPVDDTFMPWLWDEAKLPAMYFDNPQWAASEKSLLAPLGCDEGIVAYRVVLSKDAWIRLLRRHFGWITPLYHEGPLRGGAEWYRSTDGRWALKKEGQYYNWSALLDGVPVKNEKDEELTSYQAVALAQMLEVRHSTLFELIGGSK